MEKAGSLQRLPEILRDLNIQRPFAVAAPGFPDSLSFEVFRAAVPKDKIASVFAETPETLTEDAVLSALDFYKATRSDGVIALGNGAVLGLAKLIALLAGHPPPVSRYAGAAGEKNVDKARCAPLIAIPLSANGAVENDIALVLAGGAMVSITATILGPDWTIEDVDLKTT